MLCDGLGSFEHNICTFWLLGCLGSGFLLQIDGNFLLFFVLSRLDFYLLKLDGLFFLVVGLLEPFILQLLALKLLVDLGRLVSPFACL